MAPDFNHVSQNFVQVKHDSFTLLRTGISSLLLSGRGSISWSSSPNSAHSSQQLQTSTYTMALPNHNPSKGFIDGEIIVYRHEKTQQTRYQYTKSARDSKRKAALCKGIAIPVWEAYWKALDIWTVFAANRELKQELHPLGLSPPPLALPPKPAKPDNLEDVHGAPSRR